MVVLVFVYHEGNLGRSPRAFELKGARQNTFRVISHKARNHVGTGFWIRVIKFGITALRTRLVKGTVALRVFVTLLNLLRVNDIIGITETIVGQANIVFLIPTLRFVSWL
jgi:hypothetical protein